MARSQVSFSKREREKKKQKKRLEKQQRREERKTTSPSSSLEDMLAFVDENGVISNTPPDPTDKIKIKAEDIEISVPRKEAEEETTYSGVVEFLNSSKGYGFIKEAESKESVFFHINNTQENISEGDRVIFTLEKGLKGPNAYQVRKEQ